MIVTVDLETYYSSEYSLSRMSEVDYILSPKFQPILAAIKIDNGPSELFIGARRILQRLVAIDWSRAALLSHNIRFDGAILAWWFNVRPKLYLCTLSMARALIYASAGGASLAKVSRYLGLPDKGDEVVRAIDKRLEDFSVEQLVAYGAYCVRDNDNCKAAFDIFRQVMPNSELALIDQFARMFIEPQVVLDQALLAAHLADVQAEREALFQTVGHIARDVFASATKFSQLLSQHGVLVPTKLSPTTGQEIPALAKGDPAFKELCEDASQSPMVQALLAARIGAKSTAEETRTQTLLNLSRRAWGGAHQALCPIPLKYYGACTGRAAGDGGFNFLNFKRGSPLRSAVKAPPGMRIVHRDSSQIEARMVAWMARCVSLLEAFREGRDVYAEFASVIYKRKITTADKLERFVGKTAILGLGYGCGGKRFKIMLFIGNGGISVSMTEEQAVQIVYQYRSQYHAVPILWAIGDNVINRMIEASKPLQPKADFYRRLMLTSASVIPGVTWSASALWLPNGMAIQYPDLTFDMTTRANGTQAAEATYEGGPGRGRVRIYGPKVIENVSQALSRIVITDIGTRVQHQTGFRPFLNTYDSLDFCVPESVAPAFDQLLEAEFAKSPSWAETLPLASEGGWGVSLADAEHRVNQ